jgi:pSer/pThr/pTyr-binding forkhead associated (FHA) protein
MEPGASPSPFTQTPASAGTLVVQNGRQSGARRALTMPLTLIGRASGCELRLNVDGVDPLHCAIVASHAGPVLRDLDGITGTKVNGDWVKSSLLHPGDVIEVGPFQFILELPTPSTADGIPVLEPASLDGERDALRVQAAAVAAQQAELMEEELKLIQKATALERQEKQLADHLEERRRRLDNVREKVRQERAAFRDEMAAAREDLEKSREGFAAEQSEIKTATLQAQLEQKRLVELRKRLKRRWRRNFAQHVADLASREKKLAAAEATAQSQAKSLDRERQKLTEAQQRFNGESWLARRRLSEEWEKVARAQSEANENQREMESTINARARELDAQAASLAQERGAMEDQRRRLERVVAELTREAEGLEARIAHQRARLAEPAPGPAAILPTQEPIARQSTSLVVADRPWPAKLRQVAGSLADQRAHLAEQWQKLLEVQDGWQTERLAVLEQLVGLAEDHDRRERVILADERAVRNQQLDLGEQALEFRQVRARLEGWQALLTARSTAWEAERDHLRAESTARERLMTERTGHLEKIHQKRTERRRQEIAQARALHAQSEKSRHHYAALWRECLECRDKLAHKLRDLSARSLALERYRQSLVVRAEDPARASKRLTRLERREQARLEGESAELVAQRAELMAEAARLDERARALGRQEDELTLRQEAWQSLLVEEQGKQAAAEDAYRRGRFDLQRLQAQRGLDEKQLAELREEVERMARLLIEDAETALPTANAA